LSKVERNVDNRAVSPALIRDYQRALGVKVSATDAASDLEDVESVAERATESPDHEDNQVGTRSDWVDATETRDRKTVRSAGPFDSMIGNAEGGEAMKRRRMIVDLGLVGLAAPLVASEGLRHQFSAFLGEQEEPDVDEWESITREYARTFYSAPVEQHIRDLSIDLVTLQAQMKEYPEKLSDLARIGSHLATVFAMTWASAGEVRHAGRWWRTARKLSDGSGDLEARMWVRGWEVANGLYEGRLAASIAERANEGIAIGGELACPGSAGMYAGLAQTFAVAGGRDQAIAALRKVEVLTDQIPSQVAAVEDSMFGWPEVRLRHTESFVYSWLGDTRRAYSAQDQALRLYPSNLTRERAAMLFHRAACMIQDGDIVGGLRYANDVLDGLPVEHHTELVYAMGRAAIRVVPQSERDRRDVAALKERLALPSLSIGG
jgi:tetratricopeptide (TPR) repeat protein